MTMATPSDDVPAVSDGLGPDLPGAVAAERAAREEGEPTPRRGRPRGSKTKRGPGRPRKESLPPEEPIEITEADIAGAAMMSGVVWKIVGGFFNRRALTKDEARELGEAVAPVMAKYLPSFGEYAPEIGLALTVYGLWESTKLAGPKVNALEAGANGTVIEAGDDDGDEER